VNEEQWLTSTDPQAMLAFLRDNGKLTERKSRLFAVACCRRIWHLMEDERSRRAVEALERYTEGLMEVEELTVAAVAAHAVAEDDESTDNPYAAAAAANAVQAELPPDLRGPEQDNEEEVPADCIINAKDTAFASAWANGHAEHPEGSGDAWFVATKAEEAVQGHLLRDLFGPWPFRPPALDQSVLAWNGGIVRSLARAAYDDRQLPLGHLDPDRLLILADALEEAGADAELLAHLRGPGPHVRGCWAVDLVLGLS
jgi:hypothetical protein